MLRINPSSSAARTETYYKPDYYLEGQEQGGRWCGKGAARLGLSGDITAADWSALCNNRDPSTGKTLTVRQRADRTVSWDFNFHCPKSVSLVHALTGDERILKAFERSVSDTMAEVEAEAQTRVRREGADTERTTGNLTWGQYIHHTSRPVNRVPDPHLHAHCVVLNATFDIEEKRWKAVKISNIKRDAPYYEARFHSRLTGRLAELGLTIVRTRSGWELEGLTPAMLKKFSRRTELIESLAKAKGITDAVKKSELGARTRESKRMDLPMDKLRKLWRERLTGDELRDFDLLHDAIGGPPVLPVQSFAKVAADQAIEHCFERQSVVPERTVIARALRRSVGLASIQMVEQELSQSPLIAVRVDGREMVTTAEVRDEEEALVRYARDTRGSCSSLAPTANCSIDNRLSDEQRRASQHVLNSYDRIIILRGKAGTGKTFLTRETVAAIEANGRQVHLFAPSADASRGVLRSEGFAHADTLARLLVDPQMQEKVRGQVIWVDEVGLIGTKTMTRLFEIVKQADARLVLAGDRFQHASVERGSALRLLETEAGLVPAEVSEIRRQSGEYKKAVTALSQGHTAQALRQLDKLGWVRELDEEKRYQALAKDYLRTLQSNQSVLAIAPTHAEGKLATEAIRFQLREAKLLDGPQRVFTVLENARLTTAEQRDPTNFDPTDVLVYHQNARNIKKGHRQRVAEGSVALDQAERFTVFRAREIGISVGEKIRITRNGQTADGHRLENGSVHQVSGFTTAGDIRLSNGWTIGKDDGHWQLGYVTTSHASQGRSPDVVLVAQSSMSVGAVNEKQAYVSWSRGKKRLCIYTDSKKELMEAVCRDDERISAIELLDIATRRRGVINQRQNRPAAPQVPTPTREVTLDR